MSLIYDIDFYRIDEYIKDTSIETLIQVYPHDWRRAWKECTQINEDRSMENDIIDFMLHLINHFCNILEAHGDKHILFKEHIGEDIIDWNIALNHVKVRIPYNKKPY